MVLGGTTLGVPISSGVRTGTTIEGTAGGSGGDANLGTGGRALVNVCEKLGILGDGKLTADVFIGGFLFYVLLNLILIGIFDRTLFFHVFYVW
jgi:hypothetical protein